MFNPVSMCPNVPPPGLNNNGSLYGQGYGGNFMGTFQPQFVSNGPMFPACNNNTFMNVPPPGFNGMNIQGGNVPPMRMPFQKPDQMFFPHSSNMTPINSGFSSFTPPVGPYSPAQFQNQCSNYSSPGYQNFSMIRMQNNQVSYPSPRFPSFTSPPPNLTPKNCDNRRKFTSFHPHEINKKGWKGNEEKKKYLAKPWVNDALRAEVEKRFIMLEEAKTKKEPALWETYLQQKELVNNMNRTLRLEYLGSLSETAAQFHCESCDRDFFNKDKFDQHVSEHIVCGKGGCGFTAHPKIVEKHVAMQHRSGLFNRIVKGNSPEEINKWILERKKQYPTKDKIEEKEARKVEMEKRGEVYNERKKPFHNRVSNMKGRPNQFNKYTGNRPQRQFGKKSNFTDSQNEQPDNTVRASKKKTHPITLDDDDCVQRNLPSFRGTAYYINEVNNPPPDHTESLNNEIDDETIECDINELCAGSTEEYESVINDETIENSVTNKNYFFNESDSDPNESENLDDIDRTSVTSENSKLNQRVNIPSTNEKTKSSHLEKNDISDEHEYEPSGAAAKRIPESTDEVVVVPDIPVNDVSVTSSVNNQKPLSHEISETSSQKISFSSLDLIKGYYSTDEEEVADKSIAESIENNDDSGPDEHSSKITILSNTEDEVSPLPHKCDEKEELFADVDVKKQTRKRKRHKDGKSGEQEIKNEEDKQPLRAVQKYKRFRPPTLLEKQ